METLRKIIMGVILFGIFLFGNQGWPADKPEGYLATPKCGYFGPTEELMSNPGVIWTHMAGGSASHILYPYLAGYTPAELRDKQYGNDSRVQDIQGFFFNSDGKSTGGYWKRGDLTNRHFFTVNFMQFDPKGYITFQGYSCSKGFAFDSEAVPPDSTWKTGGAGAIDAWETSSHRYDDQGRMGKQNRREEKKSSSILNQEGSRSR